MNDLVPRKVEVGGLIPAPKESYHFSFKGKYLCGAAVSKDAVRVGNYNWLKISTRLEDQSYFCWGCLIGWRDSRDFVGSLMVETE